MKPINLILSKLESARRTGDGWSARCPAHEDRSPSLSIREGEDGRVLLHCHAGCDLSKVCEVLGVRQSDLFVTLPLGSHGNSFRFNAIASPPRKNGNIVESKVSGRPFGSAVEALAALERRLGNHSRRWDYHNACGSHVGSILRWDRADGKSILPISVIDEKWYHKGMLAPRPLYRLLELQKQQTVYVCEGEKATDAICQIGLAATTSAQGAQSPEKTDWNPLAGKQVIILPDNDPAGRDYAETVTTILSNLSPAPTIKIVELPGLPAKGDAVEFIESFEQQHPGEVRAEIERLSHAADEWVNNSPKEKTNQYRAFPVDALPRPLDGIVTRAAAAIGCDPSFIALPLFSALGAAVGNTRRLQVKGGWEVPPIIWTAIVARSGSSKSAGIDIARRPVQERQSRAMKQYKLEREEYERELEDYDRKLRQFQKDGKGARPTKPDEPIAERYWCDDVTVEAVAARLQDQPRGLLLIRDELSGWFGGFDRYAGGRGGDAPRWLECFGGRNMLVDRKGGEPIFVDRASVCVTGSIQPEILKKNLTETNRQNGLAARMLFALPPRRVKQWNDSEVSAADIAALKEVFDCLYQLNFTFDQDQNLAPVVLPMNSAARQMFISYYDEHNKEMLELSEDLSAAWSKLEETPARLALIIHFVRCAAKDATLKDEQAIDETSIQAGIELTQWFANEARRIYALLGEDEGDRANRELIEWIEARGGMVTARDLQQSKRAENAQDAELKLTDLVVRGFGIWEPSPSGQRGRPTRQFVLNGTVSNIASFNGLAILSPLRSGQ